LKNIQVTERTRFILAIQGP